MKKKLTDNDPRLTAYALGELPREEAEEIARMLDAPLHRPLQCEIEGIDSLGVMLTQTLGGHTENAQDLGLMLSATQRDAIFRSAKAPTVADVSSMHQSRWLRPVLVTLGAAAVVTLSFMILYNVDSDKEIYATTTFSELSENTMNAPIQPSNAEWEIASDRTVATQAVTGQNNENFSHKLPQGGVTLGDTTEELTTLVQNEWTRRADKAVTRLPLTCGKASWKWVKMSITERSLIPSKNVIRTEEILNAFDYHSPADLQQSLTTSGVELVRCPWASDCMIAVVLVQNTHTDSIELESAITFGASVEKYRLIGYAKSQVLKENIIAPAKVIMGNGDNHLAMYEILLSPDVKSGDDVLALSTRAEASSEEDEIYEEETLDVQFSDRDWKKAEQDVQFAIVLANWSQEMKVRDSSKSNLQDSSLAEMIQHLESNHSLSDKQAEAVMVMRKSLEL